MRVGKSRRHLEDALRLLAGQPPRRAVAARRRGGRGGGGGRRDPGYAAAGVPGVELLKGDEAVGVGVDGAERGNGLRMRVYSLRAFLKGVYKRSASTTIF